MNPVCIKTFKKVVVFSLPFSLYLCHRDCMCKTFVDYSFRTLFYTAIFPFTIPVATMEFIDHNIYNWSSSEYNALISKHKKEPKWDQLVNHFKKQEEILPQFDDSEIKRLLLLNKK